MSIGAGPTAGTVGHGGDVWLVASFNESSLLGFRDHPFRRATDGVHGSGSKRHGARGRDIEVPVPVGTVLRDRQGVVVCDLDQPGTRFLAAEGGQGGRGNARFLSNTRRAPAFAEQGERGQERWLDMELKLMADVALVGFPNAGKSTLISSVSAAKPKIADYPFTTLVPHLGVVRGDGYDFVMADIPGLVEGAAAGKGLGHQFLRHIERARVLVVLLDLGAPEAGGDLPSAQLRILLAGAGLVPPRAPRAAPTGGRQQGGYRCRHRIGVRPGPLRGNRGRRGAEPWAAWPVMVEQARRADAAAASSEVVVHRPAPEGVDVVAAGPRAWSVIGRAAERAVAFSDLTDTGAQAEVVRRLRRLGVDRALARAGVREGDEVTVGTMTFIWGEDV